VALDGHLVQFAIDQVKAYIMSTPSMATESAAKSVTCDMLVPTILGGTSPTAPCATISDQGMQQPLAPPRAASPPLVAIHAAPPVHYQTPPANQDHRAMLDAMIYEGALLASVRPGCSLLTGSGNSPRHWTRHVADTLGLAQLSADATPGSTFVSGASR